MERGATSEASSVASMLSHSVATRVLRNPQVSDVHEVNSNIGYAKSRNAENRWRCLAVRLAIGQIGCMRDHSALPLCMHGGVCERKGSLVRLANPTTSFVKAFSTPSCKLEHLLVMAPIAPDLQQNTVDTQSRISLQLFGPLLVSNITGQLELLTIVSACRLGASREMGETPCQHGLARHDD